MKLTDSQLVLLSAAAQRGDGAVEIDPKLKGGAAQKVLSKLRANQPPPRSRCRGRPPPSSP